MRPLYFSGRLLQDRFGAVVGFLRVLGSAPASFSAAGLAMPLTAVSACKLPVTCTIHSGEVGAGTPFLLSHQSPCSCVCLQLCNPVMSAGVKRAHLVDARLDGGMLLELYSRDGVGTMISTDFYEGIRRARSRDLEAIAVRWAGDRVDGR